MYFDYSCVNDSVISFNDIVINKNQINYSGIGGYIFKSHYLNNITKQDKSQNIYAAMCS